MVHGNKRSVLADLKSPEGQEAVRRLVRTSDVFVENFRPGVADRLGLGQAALRADDPRLVYCSVSGFREGTIYEGLAGVDPVAEALGGLASVTGEPDGAPIKAGFPIADVGTGMWGALGILSALLRRHETGAGDYVQANLLDSVLSWSAWPMSYYLMTGKNPPRLGSAHLYLAPFEFFRCRDDRHVVVGIGSDHHWRIFCAIIGREDLLTDPRFAELYERGRQAGALREILRPVFLEKDAEAWVDQIQAAGIPTAVIATMEDIAHSEYVEQADMMPTVKGFTGETRVLGFPVVFGSRALPQPTAGPELDADGHLLSEDD